MAPSTNENTMPPAINMMIKETDNKTSFVILSLFISKQYYRMAFPSNVTDFNAFFAFKTAASGMGA